jgi:hypothetical protein
MKTTIDISDPILREARKLATREGTTLRALVEEGLRRVITEKKRKRSFRLHLVTSGGKVSARSCRTQAGTRYATSPTRGTVIDRRRHQYPGLRPSNGFDVSRGGGAFHGRAFKNFLGSSPTAASISRPLRPMSHYSMSTVY